MKFERATALAQEANRLLREVSESNETVAITEAGRTAAYLVSAAEYQRIEDRLELLEGLARGEQDYREGKVVSNEEAAQRLKRWLD
ncbi:MAG: type II toxin-antitoxin system prevent-host-death family antitoxin [Verrucomicrobiota bacterium JB022]|nr:type II toxin-antitoxin system prevent-host-death family antitoxin [Verrucomicrobiota bacterium JB022]